jgi:hypothetical protein
METQKHFTVIFYKDKQVSLSRSELERIELMTGKSTMNEAFLYAVEHGADPNKLIRYKIL